MSIRALALATTLVFAGSAWAQTAPSPLVVYSAGSMTGALGAMLKRYRVETGRVTDLHTGPAGLLLDEIEGGAPADVFVSANMAHPQRLTDEHKSTATVLFARNRICVSARPAVGLTSANLLDKLLDTAIRIGTSTPKADPGGDYAWALFDKAGTLRASAAERLKAKARQIVGASVEPPRPDRPSTALAAMDQHQVDVTIGYCSSHTTTRDASVTQVQLPPDLAIPVEYGMTVLTTSGDAARREEADQLALYLMSPEAQAIMKPYGFIPVAAAASSAP